MSYLGEAGTILYLYITHQLVSLSPPPPARLNVSDEEVAARCAERGQQSAVHKALHGRTSLGAIESAYQALVDAYNLLR